MCLSGSGTGVDKEGGAGVRRSTRGGCADVILLEIE
jgi:hypothetical protein